MQPNKTKIALVLGIVFVGMSGNALAASLTFPITAKAIPDVELSTVTELSYGTSMFVTHGNSCVMDASSPSDDPAVGLMQYYGGAIATAATGYGDLSGTGCVNGAAAGTPGIYKIKGLAATDVNITISGTSGGEFFNFAPNSGCIVKYEGTNAVDSCVSFIPGNAVTTPLANIDTGEDAGGDAFSKPGQLIFTVGGTVTLDGTNTDNLIAGKLYTTTFAVNVVY